jgi:hypothetical protein
MLVVFLILGTILTAILERLHLMPLPFPDEAGLSPDSMRGSEHFIRADLLEGNRGKDQMGNDMTRAPLTYHEAEALRALGRDVPLPSAGSVPTTVPPGPVPQTFDAIPAVAAANVVPRDAQGQATLPNGKPVSTGVPVATTGQPILDDPSGEPIRAETDEPVVFDDVAADAPPVRETSESIPPSVPPARARAVPTPESQERATREPDA